MDLAHRRLRRLIPDFTFICSGGGMNCVSCDICVYHLWFVCVFFPGVFLSSSVTEACPVTTDLIVRVNVRTTTRRLYPYGSKSAGHVCAKKVYLRSGW